MEIADTRFSVIVPLSKGNFPELESLGETLLDFQDINDLENWLTNHIAH